MVRGGGLELVAEGVAAGVGALQVVLERKRAAAMAWPKVGELAVVLEKKRAAAMAWAKVGELAVWRWWPKDEVLREMKEEREEEKMGS